MSEEGEIIDLTEEEEEKVRVPVWINPPVSVERDPSTWTVPIIPVPVDWSVNDYRRPVGDVHASASMVSGSLGSEQVGLLC
jgi:hypothetical protein